MTATQVLLIFSTGLVAGILNTVGGGGSLLSLPVLIFMGLPSAVANGTNRVALMVQNIVAISYFRHKGYFYPKLSVILGIPAILGSVAGAHFAITLSDEMFNKTLAVIMLTVLVLILWRPEQKLLKKKQDNIDIQQHEMETDNGNTEGKGEGENFSPMQLTLAAITFFGVGFYGGFIQAGVGFIIIATLTLITGMSLVKINSLKVLVVAIYMLSSLLIFIFSGKVDWILGFTLAAGNAVGAYLGSAFAVSKGDKYIRVFLIVTVIIMSGKLLGIHKLFG
ncbi:MAG: sulfite exporter TauE/SafE family protein [Firmicutes bacterium]|nr:sulfite exporter TauE/SafE family protein [Bacillota bacterium]